MQLKLIAIISMLFLVSCKNQAAQQANQEEVFELSEIPPDFLEFYKRFHSDSIFQIEHILFPLAVKSDGTKWTQEEWTMHKSFLDQEGFTSQLLNFEGLITESITDRDKLFQLIRRFVKMDDEWTLIHYSTELTVQDFEEVEQ